MFENDPRKGVDMRALRVVFNVRNWKTFKKFAEWIFSPLRLNPELVLSSACLAPRCIKFDGFNFRNNLSNPKNGRLMKWFIMRIFKDNKTM